MNRLLHNLVAMVLNLVKTLRKQDWVMVLMWIAFWLFVQPLPWWRELLAFVTVAALLVWVLYRFGRDVVAMERERERA